MVNSAIITVKEFSGYEIGDFELPIKMPVSYTHLTLPTIA